MDGLGWAMARDAGRAWKRLGLDVDEIEIEADFEEVLWRATNEASILLKRSKRGRRRCWHLCSEVKRLDLPPVTMSNPSILYAASRGDERSGHPTYSDRFFCSSTYRTRTSVPSKGSSAWQAAKLKQWEEPEDLNLSVMTHLIQHRSSVTTEKERLKGYAEPHVSEDRKYVWLGFIGQ